MAFFALPSRKASRMALAVAIMGMGTLSVTAVDAPAYAKKKKEEEEPKQDFSDAFRKAFLPIQEAAAKEDADKAELLESMLAVESSVSTADDKMLFGNQLYSTALDLKNYAVASKGVEMMLDSGKVAEANLPQYNYIAGQLAYNAKDYDTSRSRLKQAIALGYEDSNAPVLVTQSYMLQDDNAAATSYAIETLESEIAAGKKPNEELINFAFSLAYNNDMYADAGKLALIYARYYPSEKSWQNAIGVERNLGNYEDSEVLDLMRLARAADAMSDARMYADYIDAANYRRLPAEVLVVAQEGVDKGLLSKSDAFVSEALKEGKDRSPGLRADLAALERDAKKSGETGSLAIAAGNAFLNFGESAKAAELYELALTRSDTDRGEALTRLGIAQVQAGDYAAAQTTFEKVEGKRAPIAQLWAAYAAQAASAG